MIVEIFNLAVACAEYDELCCVYSDMHKDAFGCRYRGPAMTIEEIKADMDRLQLIIEDELAMQAQAQKQAIADVEEKIRILISIGAKNRGNAIRWLLDGADVGGDLDHLCYNLGLPFGYFNKAA